MIQLTCTDNNFTASTQAYSLNFAGLEAAGLVNDATGAQVLTISFIPSIDGLVMQDFVVGKICKGLSRVGQMPGR
jgi:hypothetical protein